MLSIPKRRVMELVTGTPSPDTGDIQTRAKVTFSMVFSLNEFWLSSQTRQGTQSYSNANDAATKKK
jgi:hypothetical protein